MQHVETKRELPRSEVHIFSLLSKIALRMMENGQRHTSFVLSKALRITFRPLASVLKSSIFMITLIIEIIAGTEKILCWSTHCQTGNLCLGSMICKPFHSQCLQIQRYRFDALQLRDVRSIKRRSIGTLRL